MEESITKVIYKNNESKIIDLLEYIFYEADLNLYLVFKLKNNYKEPLLSFDLVIKEYNQKNELIKEDIFSYQDINIKKNKEFVPLKKMQVSPYTKSISYEVLNAKFKKSEFKDGAFIKKEKNKDKSGLDKPLKYKFKTRRILHKQHFFFGTLILLLVVGVLSFFFTKYIFSYRIKNLDEFSYNDVTYKVEEDGLTVLGSNLKEVTIPKTVFDYDVKKIADEAFKDSTLEVINLPDDIIIGKKAFMNSSSLKSVLNLENKSLTASSLGESAFEGCGVLKTFVSAKTIPYHAYSNCSSLLTIKSDSVENIENSAIVSCTSLETIDALNANLTYNSFSNSYNSLLNLSFNNSSTSTIGDVFGTENDLINIKKVTTKQNRIGSKFYANLKYLAEINYESDAYIESGAFLNTSLNYVEKDDFTILNNEVISYNKAGSEIDTLTLDMPYTYKEKIFNNNINNLYILDGTFNSNAFTGKIDNLYIGQGYKKTLNCFNSATINNIYVLGDASYDLGEITCENLYIKTSDLISESIIAIHAKNCFIDSVSSYFSNIYLPSFVENLTITNSNLSSASSLIKNAGIKELTLKDNKNYPNGLITSNASNLSKITLYDKVSSVNSLFEDSSSLKELITTSNLYENSLNNLPIYRLEFNDSYKYSLSYYAKNLPNLNSLILDYSIYDSSFDIDSLINGFDVKNLIINGTISYIKTKNQSLNIYATNYYSASTSNVINSPSDITFTYNGRNIQKTSVKLFDKLDFLNLLSEFNIKKDAYYSINGSKINVKDFDSIMGPQYVSINEYSEYDINVERPIVITKHIFNDVEVEFYYNNDTLEDPVLDGYVFLGWYLESSYSNRVTEISTDLYGYELTLYARFKDASNYQKTDDKKYYIGSNVIGSKSFTFYSSMEISETIEITSTSDSLSYTIFCDGIYHQEPTFTFTIEPYIEKTLTINFEYSYASDYVTIVEFNSKLVNEGTNGISIKANKEALTYKESTNEFYDSNLNIVDFNKENYTLNYEVVLKGITYRYSSLEYIDMSDILSLKVIYFSKK